MKLSELAATKWSGNDVKIATAVALAESRGKLDATHKNSDGSTDYGPWQVNSVHGYDPARLTSDPEYTVNAAYSVWGQQGWGAWTTYKTGAYLAFMGQDAELSNGGGGIIDSALTGLKDVALSPGAGAKAVGGAAKDAAGAVTGAASDTLGLTPVFKSVGVIADVVGALTEPSTWLRIGKGYVGVVLVITGVGALTYVVANRVSSAPVVKTATRVIP